MRLSLASAGLMAVTLSLAPTLGRAAEGVTWKPSMDEVVALERGIEMPSGADPLQSYARYYTGDDVDGRKVIRGYYLSQGTPGIHMEPSNLIVMDGGCSVVSVVFDVQSRKVLGVACNGVA